MTFGVDLARRVAPRAVTNRPMPLHGVGSLAVGARRFGQHLALSHVQRQALLAESTDDLSVRPPIDYWPWPDDEPTPVFSPKVEAVVPSGDRKLDALRRMLAGGGPGESATSATAGAPAQVAMRHRPIRRGLPRALRRTATLAGPGSAPGALADRMQPEPVDPATVAATMSTNASAGARPGGRGAGDERLQRLRTMLDQPDGPARDDGGRASLGERSESPSSAIPAASATSEWARRSPTLRHDVQRRAQPPAPRSSTPSPDSPERGAADGTATAGPNATVTDPIAPLPLASVIRRAPAVAPTPADAASAMRVESVPAGSDLEPPATRSARRSSDPQPPAVQGEAARPTARRSPPPTVAPAAIPMGDDRVRSPFIRAMTAPQPATTPLARRSTMVSAGRDQTSPRAPSTGLIRRREVSGAPTSPLGTLPSTSATAALGPEQLVLGANTGQPRQTAGHADPVTSLDAGIPVVHRRTEIVRPAVVVRRSLAVGEPATAPTPSLVRGRTVESVEAQRAAARQAADTAASPDVAVRTPGSPDSVRPPIAVDPGERFLGELARRPRVAPQPLPRHLQPLATAIVGDRRVRVSTDAASQAALREVGKVAATAGDVIHLARTPASRADHAVVAHELTHIAHPSPLPRFFDDDRPSPEERQAEQMAEVIRRSPILPRESAAADPAIRRMPTRPTLTAAPTSPSASTSAPSFSGDTLSAAALAASITGATAPSISSGAGTTVRRLLSESGESPFDQRKATGERARVATESQGGESVSGHLFPFDINDAIGRRDFVQWVVEALGDRFLLDLEPRGGRFRGEF